MMKNHPWEDQKLQYSLLIQDVVHDDLLFELNSVTNEPKATNGQWYDSTMGIVEVDWVNMHLYLPKMTMRRDKKGGQYL